MIPTYNCADLLRKTLEGVLVQDLGPERMQIEVVDDCSSQDDPQSVTQEIAGERVSFYRQPQNVGATANFNTCIQRSCGEIVHILHGDDTVLPGFYSRLDTLFSQYPKIGAAFCRYVIIDERGSWQSMSPLEQEKSGVLASWMQQIVVKNLVQFPAIVTKRKVYEELGGFNEHLVHAADWEMWKRIAVHYSVAYEPQPLACYRVHSVSHSSGLIRTGSNIADIRRSIAITKTYLPPKTANVLTKRALETYALIAQDTARALLGSGDFRGALAQTKEALKCSRSPRVLGYSVRLLRDAHYARWLGPALVRFHQGDVRTARELLLKGIATNPLCLFNGGVLSILADTTVGPRITDPVRTLRKHIRQIKS